MTWIPDPDRPDELVNHGYDATIWRWQLRDTDTDRLAQMDVRISGSAMAAHLVPEVVRRARESRGRSVVDAYATWTYPPKVVELRTTTERPQAYGGVKSAGEGSEGELQSIVQWFDDHGIDLNIERQGETWAAVMIPRHVRFGSAAFGSGTSAIEAARDAQRRFDHTPAQR